MTPTLATKPTLVGQRVLLRPMLAGDATMLSEAVADAEGNRLTGTHATFTAEQLARWAATRSDHDDRLDLVVVDHDAGNDGAAVGEVVLNDLDPDNRSCGFRINLLPRARGRGLGTEATRLVLAHAFDTVGLHRVQLEVYAHNPRARHVYERVGFVHEGTLRQSLLWDGEWIDTHVMGLISDGWLAHRGDA